MKWGSAISQRATLSEAVAETAEQVAEQLAGAAPDLSVLFISNRYEDEYDQVVELMARAALPGGPGLVFGCSAEGVIGGAHEVEGRPAFSLTAAHLPGVTLTPFRLAEGGVPNEDAPPDAWSALMGVSPEDNPDFLLLTDPFSFRPEELLSGLDYAFPTSVKAGGIASGARRAGANALILGEQRYSDGCVGIALTGDVRIDAVVAQGCRPIGQPMRVTRCQSNILIELEETAPLQILRTLIEGLSERDRELARHSLFLGIVMDPMREEEPRQGDFLIRNVMGIDPRSGAMAIGERLREGMQVQFQLRDAETAAEDLDAVLTQYVWGEVGRKPEGALLFSCLGRGEHLFGRPNHDTNLFTSRLGPIPLGGFFCNGEIGPVGGVSFLHGYTSSFALFRPRAAPTVG